MSQDVHENQKTKHHVDLTLPLTSRSWLLFEVSRLSIVRAQEAPGIPEMWIPAMQAMSIAVESKPGMSVPLRARARVLILRIQLVLGDQSKAKYVSL
jgi:hypothetical protein